MSKKKIFIFYCLIAMILPLSFLLNGNIQEAKGNWLEDPQELNSFGFNFIEPEIAFDSKGIMHCVFTEYTIEDGKSEILIANNSNLEYAEDIFNRNFQLTERPGNLHPMNTSFNSNPDIAIDDNDIIHYVWQGKFGDDQNGDYEIFYTNSSNDDYYGNMINITKTPVDNTDPSIAIVNNTVYIAYMQQGDVKIKTNEGPYSLTEAAYIEITNDTNNDMPELSAWESPDGSDWRLDLSYRSTGAVKDITIVSVKKGEKVTDLIGEFKKIAQSNNFTFNNGSAISWGDLSKIDGAISRFNSSNYALNFSVAINLTRALYDTQIDFMKLNYTYITNISQKVEVSVYNNHLFSWDILNNTAGNNKTLSYATLYALNSSHVNNKEVNIRFIAVNGTNNHFNLSLEQLKIKYYLKDRIMADVLNYSIDSNERMAAISYHDATDDHIYIANTTKSTISTQITQNNNDRQESKVIINDNDIITVFWIQNSSSSTPANVTIESADNYGNYFKNISTIISKEQFSSKIDIRYFDAEICQGEGVFLIYSAREFDKLTGKYEQNNILYISAYGHIYNDGTRYNTYSWSDDLGGIAASEAYVIEAIQISYNTSVGRDLNLTLRLTDSNTGDSWIYISKFNGSGGNDYTTRFYRENGDYFVAYNKFKIELFITNPDGIQELVKIELDPLELAKNEVNYSSNVDGEDNTFAYTINDFSSGFEFTVFRFDNARHNQLLTRSYTKDNPKTIGILDDENYVDFYKFELTQGETYNMSLNIDKNGDKVKLLIYNSTPVITSEESAVKIYSMNSWNGKSFLLTHSKTNPQIYFIAIIKYNETAGLNYTFNYRVCPLAARLITPSGTYLGADPITNKVSYIFKWDLNDDESLFDDNDIDYYNFKIFNEEGVLRYSRGNYPNKTLNITLTNTYNLKLPDGIYKWQVVIVTKQNQRSFGNLTESIFYIDTKKPDAPVLDQPETYFKVNTFKVSWSKASDDIFSVHHYELYSSTEKYFEVSSSTLVDNNILFTSKIESSKDTGAYYYKVVAVDNVGLKSDPSNIAEYVVSLFGHVEAFGNYQVLEGDYIEYKVTDVSEENVYDPNDLYATLNGERFQMNSLFRYYISEINKENFLPVKGHLYKKWMNVTAQQLKTEYLLLTRYADVAPFVTTDNTTHQFKVFNLSLTRQFGESIDFEYDLRKSVFQDTFRSIDVYVHTFYLNMTFANKTSDTDVEYHQAIYVVDANKGVLIKTTFYNERANFGYSIKLVNTNIGLSEKNTWWITPFLIIATLGIIAAILNQIKNALERRV